MFHRTYFLFQMTWTLEHFTPVIVEETDRLTGNVPCKTCQLDHMASERNTCVDLTICVIADGCFQSVFKGAVV